MTVEQRTVYTPVPLATTIVSLVLAIVLDRVYPIAEVIPFPYNLLGVLGVVFTAYVFVEFFRLFCEDKTTVKPGGVSTALVTRSIFRLSRNPIYLADLVIIISVSVLLGSLSPYILAIIFFIVANWIVIPFEEQRLEELFGDKYLSYKSAVRRWL